MIIQISSGQGPAECELAVNKFYNVLCKEYGDIEILSSHISKRSGYYTSILISSEADLTFLNGTVQWICKSPIRPSHKRQNWYIDVSVIPEKGNINKEKEVRFEHFHSGGKGGQNVNKVETGVRLIHIPTGITVTSTSERSQYMNKKDALNKLVAILEEKENQENAKQSNMAWREHTKIVRGNPVRIYEGMEFRRKK